MSDNARKIGIIGAGYVGLTTALGFSDLGYMVMVFDIDNKKIERLKKGDIPFYEPLLSNILKKNLNKNFFVTNTYNKLVSFEPKFIFITVGTPSNSDGSINLEYVKKASKEIGELIKVLDGYVVVIVKSTVVPGTTVGMVKKTIEERSRKVAGKDFGISMNPEFLKEGTAFNDFMNPDKIVIGVEDELTKSLMLELYNVFDKKIPRIVTDITTAEMIKYAQNSFLATKISFINEIANMCELFGVDINVVSYAIGLDKRIGPEFLRAGVGFGGSCFPKDVKAIIQHSKKRGYEPILLESVIKVNEAQPYRAINLIKRHYTTLNGLKVGLLGLSFKPNTDDIREAPSIKIARKLVDEGADVYVYDPIAMENFKKVFGNTVKYAESSDDLLKRVKVAVLVTEWDMFKKIDFFSYKNLELLVDGRRIYDPKKLPDWITYCGIGWKND